MARNKMQSTLWNVQTVNLQDMNQKEAKRKTGRKGNLYKNMTLSTVCLKLAHQSFDQDKLYFYFGHGK
jgi:hypothetical protein